MLSDVPTVNNGKLIIKQGGVEKGSFTANQSGNVEIDLESGGGAYYITYTAIHMFYSGAVDTVDGDPIEDFFVSYGFRHYVQATHLRRGAISYRG